MKEKKNTIKIQPSTYTKILEKYPLVPYDFDMLFYDYNEPDISSSEKKEREYNRFFEFIISIIDKNYEKIEKKEIIIRKVKKIYPPTKITFLECFPTKTKVILGLAVILFVITSILSSSNINYSHYLIFATISYTCIIISLFFCIFTYKTSSKEPEERIEKKIVKEKKITYIDKSTINKSLIPLIKRNFQDNQNLLDEEISILSKYNMLNIYKILNLPEYIESKYANDIVLVKKYSNSCGLFSFGGKRAIYKTFIFHNNLLYFPLICIEVLSTNTFICKQIVKIFNPYIHFETLDSSLNKDNNIELLGCTLYHIMDSGKNFNKIKKILKNKIVYISPIALWGVTQTFYVLVIQPEISKTKTINEILIKANICQPAPKDFIFPFLTGNFDARHIIL